MSRHFRSLRRKSCKKRHKKKLGYLLLSASPFFLLSLALCQNNGASVLLIGGRANTGLVDQLLQTLKGIDPARGDKLDDRPEIEEMYQASVALQGQINTLIKKYSDQKGEF